MASDEFESPVDLADPAGTGPALGWAATGIALATLFLLATNSIALKSFVDEQPPGRVQAQIATAATAWHERMTAIGLAAPRAWLNGLWTEAEAADQR